MEGHDWRLGNWQKATGDGNNANPFLKHAPRFQTADARMRDFCGMAIGDMQLAKATPTP
jgi:hypothetical protein